jgi:hypothetical protein
MPVALPRLIGRIFRNAGRSDFCVRFLGQDARNRTAVRIRRSGTVQPATRVSRFLE